MEIMLKANVLEALNKQVNAELYSAYLYLSMSAYLQSQNLKGMAKWMAIQAQEEVGHAMKLYEFIHERGGRVSLAALEAPKKEWDAPAAAFEDAYRHECKITGLINQLVELAHGEKDHASNVFLQWFVTEQVEEEASTLEIAEKVKLLRECPGAMLALDKELGQRGAS
jgi:ferritin